MSDPHVVKLHYKVSPKPEGLEYKDPPAVDWQRVEANYHLENGILTVQLKKHYSTPEEACAAVKPDLDAWEASAELSTRRIGALRFQLTRACISDRNTQKEISSTDTNILTSIHFEMGSYHQTLANYPDPPMDFNSESYIVHDLLTHFRMYAEGKELEQSMANAVLTRIEQAASGGKGSRKRAAKNFRIDHTVLSKLGGLVSGKYGTPKTVRKFDKQHPPRPMTRAETKWLKAVIPAIIRQVAAVEAGAEPPLLTLESLPPLATEQGGISDADDTS